MTSPFAVLRLVSLYLLSVSAAAGALLAWPSRRPHAFAALTALGCAVALVAGEAATPVAGDLQRTWRARGRLLFTVAHAGLAGTALLLVAGVPEPFVLARAAWMFALLQPVLLLLAGTLDDVRLSLSNVAVLVVLAALRGGPLASLVAVATFLSGALFLLADHATRVLGAYAARRAPGVSAVLRDGLGVAAPIAAALAGVLWWAPPRPWAAVRWVSGAPEALPPRAYALLVFVGLIGAGAVGLAAQLVRRRRRKPPPGEEIIQPLAVEEEAVPATPPSTSVPIRGPRARIVGAYLSVLRAAARRGRVRAPGDTPLEFAAFLGAMPGLGRLTELFMDARYGREEPDGARIAEAERAADEAVRAVSGLRAPARARR